MKEYFSHDYNSRSNEKIKQLIRKHGYEGYGLYWSIVEDLYMNANALRMDCEGIAYDYRTDTKTIESILSNFDLFENDGEFFWSNSVQKRLDLRNEKSNKAKKSAESRWKKGKNDANALDIDANALRTECESNAIKEKERKEKENKGKNIIREDSKNEAHASLTPTPQQVEILTPYETESTSIVLKEKGKGVARAERFDFVKALTDIGVSEEYATAWVDIRKKKKATNSDIAFKLIRNELEKAYMAGMQPNDCVEYAIKREWKGFEYSWIVNDKNRNNGLKTKHQQFDEDLSRLGEKCARDSYNAQFITREQELAKYKDVPF